PAWDESSAGRRRPPRLRRRLAPLRHHVPRHLAGRAPGAGRPRRAPAAEGCDSAALGADFPGGRAGAPPDRRARPPARGPAARARDAARAAWAWRRYVGAAREPETERRVEIRYEELVAEPAAVAERLAAALELEPAPLAAAFATAHGRSVGSWRRLSEQELSD